MICAACGSEIERDDNWCPGCEDYVEPIEEEDNEKS